MKFITNTLLGLFAICLLAASCADSPSSSQVNSETELVEPGNFSSFLDLFQETKGFDSWDKKVVDVVGGIGGVFDPAEVRDKTLDNHFTEINPEFHHFIPTSSIVNLDPKYSQNIPDPLVAYQFWATYKSRVGETWLFCVFALKKEWVSREGYHEFHAHPVMLLTYSGSGKLIDHFVWTYMNEDGVQLYDDVDVSGDTLVTGWYSHQTGKIDKVYSRTVIDASGKFNSIYRAKQ